VPEAFDLVESEPDEEEKGEHVRRHQHVEDQQVVIRKCACAHLPSFREAFLKRLSVLEFVSFGCLINASVLLLNSLDFA